MNFWQDIYVTLHNPRAREPNLPLLSKFFFASTVSAQILEIIIFL
jgi:hypothetical protein